MTSFKWGFLGTGNIAREMASALQHVPGAQRFAVASRSQSTAHAFASEFKFDRAYGGYDKLMADPDIDIVYIATPNGLHKSNILAALAAGKHVLCEKPMTLSVEDSELCFAAAREAGLFLMEALWTAFFPAMRNAIEIVRSGEIGAPHHLTANFVSLRSPDAFPILFDPALGGGARNDLGIYPVAVALLLAGPARRVVSQSVMGPSGVDEMTALTMEHETGALSVLSCGFRAEMPIALRCVCEKGSIEISNNFHRPDHVTVVRDGRTETLGLPYLGNGYAHEAIAFQEYVGGLSDDMLWPESATLSASKVLSYSSSA